MLVHFTGDPNTHFLNDLRRCFERDSLVADRGQDATVIWVEWANQQAIAPIHRHRGKKILVRCHAHELDNPESFRRIPWEHVDVLVFVSRVKHDLFKRRYPDISVRTCCIPNAIDTERFAFRPKAECGFAIGMLGRVYPNKGILGALLLLRLLDKRWQLIVQGEVRRKHRRYALLVQWSTALLGLRDRVEFAAHNPHPQAFFDRIDIILSNSRAESFHAVVAEGMSCGCYPVVHDWPGARDLYPESQIYATRSAFLAIVRRYEAMSRSERLAVAEGHRTFVSTRYGVEPVYHRYQELLASL